MVLQPYGDRTRPRKDVSGSDGGSGKRIYVQTVLRDWSGQEEQAALLMDAALVVFNVGSEEDFLVKDEQQLLQYSFLIFMWYCVFSGRLVLF